MKPPFCWYRQPALVLLVLLIGFSAWPAFADEEDPDSAFEYWQAPIQSWLNEDEEADVDWAALELMPLSKTQWTLQQVICPVGCSERLRNTLAAQLHQTFDFGPDPTELPGVGLCEGPKQYEFKRTSPQRWLSWLNELVPAKLRPLRIHAPELRAPHYLQGKLLCGAVQQETALLAVGLHVLVQVHDGPSLLIYR